MKRVFLFLGLGIVALAAAVAATRAPQATTPGTGRRLSSPALERQLPEASGRGV